MNEIQEIKKERLIKRIIRHSEVFNFSYLKKKSLDDLKRLQRDTLIELRVKMKFQSRHTSQTN